MRGSTARVDGSHTEARRVDIMRIIESSPIRAELPHPLPLVGRSEELARLEALMEGDGSGPAVVFVRGEGGVGKTRLASELALRARSRSWVVAHGRAYPVESGTPYSIFSDAWLPILNAMDESTLTVLSRGGEAQLRTLFPALRAGGGDVDANASGEPDDVRTRLMWNFTEFVKRYAGRSPVLCVLEDLQWADSSSLELLHFLARQIHDTPLVIVGTYNDQERDQSRRLVDTERSLGSIRVAEVLALQALSLGQIGELVSRTFGVESDVVREFAAILYGWTRGNAFFVEETLKALVAGGRLRPERGTWVGWDAQEFQMPGSIRDAIVQRLADFSDPARAVAEMASVVGTRVTYAIMSSITGLDDSDVLNALEELRGNGIVDEHVEDDRVVYDFRYPLVRQTLYDDIGMQRVRVLHGKVAEALERYYGPAAAEHADELAFHFARTDGGEFRGKAKLYLTTAGRTALERRADAEAINYLQSALDLVDGESPTSSEALAELVPMLARAHARVGHFDEAAALWETAAGRLSADDARYPDIQRALGITNVWRGRHDTAAASFEAGLSAARRRGDDRATVRLLVAKAHGLHELGRAEEALAALHDALPIAEGLADAGLLARVYRARALLHVWVGPPDKAIQDAERAIALAREVKNLSIEFWARWGLAVLTGMRGDTEAMSQAIDEVNAIADRARSPVLRLWTTDMSVELAYARGEWDDGIARAEKAISVARSLSQRTLLPRLLVWTSQFHVARGDLERAEELVAEAGEIARLHDEQHSLDVHQVVPTYIGLALYRLALGDYDEAIAAAEKGLEIAEGTGYILWAIHLLLPVLGEACLWAGKIDRAEEVGRRMRAHSERIDHRLGLAWADACDSLVRWKRGDPAGAIDLMRAATDELDSIPMIWPATRLRRQLAGRLAEIGREDEALEELDRVHGVCVRLRAGLELGKARGMYAEIGKRPPPIPNEDEPLGLTAAERQVAVVVAEGKSNKAVAVALGCATRTVSTHLSNIYTKLDIGGPGARVRLGNLVREAGLGEEPR